MAGINPEWLDTSGAATYLSMRMDTFRKKVRAGVLPPPSHMIGERSPRWRRSDLDSMMTPTASDNNSWVTEYVASLKEGKDGKSTGYGKPRKVRLTATRRKRS